MLLPGNMSTRRLFLEQTRWPSPFVYRRLLSPLSKDTAGTMSLSCKVIETIPTQIRMFARIEYSHIRRNCNMLCFTPTHASKRLSSTPTQTLVPFPREHSQEFGKQSLRVRVQASSLRRLCATLKKHTTPCVDTGVTGSTTAPVVQHVLPWVHPMAVPIVR